MAPGRGRQPQDAPAQAAVCHRRPQLQDAGSSRSCHCSQDQQPARARRQRLAARSSHLSSSTAAAAAARSHGSRLRRSAIARCPGHRHRARRVCAPRSGSNSRLSNSRGSIPSLSSRAAAVVAAAAAAAAAALAEAAQQMRHVPRSTGPAAGVATPRCPVGASGRPPIRDRCQVSYPHATSSFRDVRQSPVTDRFKMSLTALVRMVLGSLFDTSGLTHASMPAGRWVCSTVWWEETTAWQGMSRLRRRCRALLPR